MFKPGTAVAYKRPSWARSDLFESAVVVEYVSKPGCRGYVVEFGLGRTLLPATRLRPVAD